MIVWLASYPRSGNTFFRVFVHSVFGLKSCSLYGDKDDIAADEGTSDIVGHEVLPDDFDFQAARSDDLIHLIKTHGLPENNEDRVIYLVRDGRNCLLSYMHHLCDFSDLKVDLWDVIYGNVPFGSWGEHLKAWDPRNRPNTLLIRFEELISRPGDFIEPVSAFLSCPVTSRSIPGFTELNKINSRFFRSGKKNGWKAIYTQEELLGFWSVNFRHMFEFDYGKDVPDSLCLSDDEEVRLCSLLGLQGRFLKKILIEKEKYKQELESLPAEDPRKLRYWAEKSERDLIAEREISSGLRQWIERSDAALVEEREMSLGLRQWAEKSDAALVEERELSLELRQWAEKSDAALVEEREVSSRFRRWAEKSDAVIAGEKEVSGRMRQWAEKSEAMLTKEKNISNELRQRVEYLESELVEAGEISDLQRNVLNSRKKMFVRIFRYAFSTMPSYD